MTTGRRSDIICVCNYRGIGGAQLNAAMLADAFADRGYASHLVFLFDREHDFAPARTSQSVLAPAPPRSPQGWWRFLRECSRELVLHRPRAIFGFQPAANVVGALAAAKAGDCVMVATQRNPADRQSPVVGLVERVVGGTGLYRSNIAVSADVARSYDHHGRSYVDKMRVVHNATPTLPTVDETIQQCREQLGMVGNGQILGCIGRLHTQKNLPFALEVLALSPDAQLYLAGDGPERQALATEAEALGVGDRVHFLGPLGGEDIVRFYTALDVLLFPSLYEGFGRVLVEAMAQGTPIIASDIAITREVCGEAVVYRPFDAAQWAASLGDLKNDARRSSLAAAGRRRAEHFTLNAMVDGYLSAAGLSQRNHG